MSRKRLIDRLVTEPSASKATRDLRDAVRELQDDLPEWEEVEFTFALANTSYGVQHGLGRLATRYIPIKKLAAADIYDGVIPAGAPANQIWLRSTVATTVTLLVY
jgi:hypothetical protein